MKSIQPLVLTGREHGRCQKYQVLCPECEETIHGWLPDRLEKTCPNCGTDFTIDLRQRVAVFDRKSDEIWQGS